MIKIRIEETESGEVQELEGRFVWGAIENNEEQEAAFAVGRNDPTVLPVRMAKICVSIILANMKLNRDDPATQIVKKLFQYLIDKEFEEETFETETIAARVEKVKE